jgi:calcineurin-like phosphoesterase family protein
MMIYFTSDTHFGHANIIKYTNRPFNNVKVMDDILIRNWNLRVTNKDKIFHLGDFGFGSSGFLKDICGKLNGQKVFITGSHDHRLNKIIPNSLQPNDTFGMTFVGPLYSLKGLKGIPDIILCHYSMKVWSKCHYGTWHLFGHSHGKLEGVGKSFDVGVDANQFRPISLDEVVKRMESRPDNPNLVRRES